MKKNEEQVEKKLRTIENWYEIQEELVLLLSNLHGHDVTREEVFNALFIRLSDKFNLEWPGDLWDLKMDFDEALHSIIDFDFRILNESIVSHSSLIPDKLLLNYKVRIKSKGLIWIIHMYDKDPFPSNPHAHQLENNIKLDLSNGKCYKVRHYIHTLDKKDLLHIREEAKKVFIDP
ncbi:hypothetical protein [Spirosoma linguale]|uniref:Uncharacterized protein n=1 Tax=Spirosoma linguale (strain ATCC 33905 / DSM 74 / LMG 10896 / Claus 1) TaxID=504472 RepID=D2QFH0_SPILD|nr:hypothetical protein Slin_2323 [Spirosoma linguale DSM 74]